MNQEAANLSSSLALRGVLAILFGAAAVFWPGLTLVTVVYIFSAFILVNGLVDLIFGVTHLASGDKSAATRVLTLLFGVFQIAVGVYLLRHPSVSFATLVLLIGFTLIIRGVFEIIAGLFEEGSAMYRTVTVFGGLLALVAGGLLLEQPAKAGVAFVWILGFYGLIVGALTIALALDVKKVATPSRGR